MDPPPGNGSFYTTLDTSRDEIRLLEITSVEPIVCKLSIVSLLDKPEFSALSYTWGDASVTEPIIVEGRSIAVTTSLTYALKAVYFQWTEGCCSDDNSGHRIWVDAVCINQPDVQEKNSQIPLMYKIYTSAQRTFCWIGLPIPDLLDAFDIFTYLFQEIDSRSKNEQEGENLLKTIDVDLMALVPRMNNLFFTQYWRRMWIVQELVLSKEALLVSGTKALPLAAISCVNNWLKVYGSRRDPTSTLVSREEQALETEALRARIRDLNYLEIAKIETARLFVEKRAAYLSEETHVRFCRAGMYMYNSLSTYAATNPKDLVYGLMGVSGFTLAIDYSPAKTIANVYCDFVAKWLSTCGPESLKSSCGDLWFLAHAGIGHAWEMIPGLPSWAPNFVAISKLKVAQGRIFCTVEDRSMEAFGNHRLIPTCSAGNLHCAAAFVDEIADTGPAITELTGIDGPPAQWIQWVVEALVRSPIHPRSQRHRAFSLLEAILHVRFMESMHTKEEMYATIYGYPQLVHWFLFLLFETWKFNYKNDDEHAFYAAFCTDHIWDSDEFDPHESARWRSMRATPELSSPGLGQTIYCWIAALEDISGLRPFETKEGYFGLCPPLTEEGDIIAVLCGCSHPVVLRKMGDHYSHVGVCYVSEYISDEKRSGLNATSFEAKKIEIR
ncbi:hypothetical protein GT037_007180 [Alternaria burnsii]|uniref:Heterokaryon incompatibility domain-containing protein n=1 Tax=Alternaria burnsii TaxID=1187904 RepID=A0A8H7B315_9PLEO|nr:uncharacterized protein GT037_007180 [Alternaria burnsii]KAF7674420.1 hypothetical protein GT037_007180 [Alternaria burnsii]CAI9629832.1 unnamed protein product [Alternaria burnsii]